MAVGSPLPAPLPAPPAAAGMSRGTRILLWSLGGCAGVGLVLLVGAMVFAAMVGTRMFNFHLDASAPADFPVYAGARQTTGMSMGSKDRANGMTVSLVQWDVPARPDIVTTWYKSHLNDGDWQVDGDDSPGITFHRRSTGAVATLMIRGSLSSTLVQLEMTGGQPLGAGAHRANMEVPSSSQ